MDPFQNSDSDSKMVATRTFEDILEHVRSSNLNFHLQQSPFAAQISLKKSLVKDRAGVLVTPPRNPRNLLQQSNSDIADLAKRNLHLEKRIETLQGDYEHSALDCEDAHRTIAKL